MNKGQSSLFLVNMLISVVLLALSFALTYAVPLLVIAACIASGLIITRKKGSSGQAELLVSLALVLVTAGSVVAYTAMNGTMNISFTGNFLAANLTAGDAVKTIEATSTIEVWADTHLGVFSDNGTVVAELLMDDGTPAGFQEIEFAINGESHTLVTDLFGLASMPINTSIINEIEVSYFGNSSEYLNPSKAQAETRIWAPEENVTGNVTRPEIRIEKIDAPAVVNVSEEYEVRVFVTSLHGVSVDVVVRLQSRGGIGILGGPEDAASAASIQRIPEIRENESAVLKWSIRPESCGNHTLDAEAENNEGAADLESFDVNAPCELFAAALDETMRLGNLTITLVNISEGSYNTFELDENFARVERRYYRAYARVFNDFSRIPGIYTLEDNELIDILLEDDMGNSYGQDDEITFFLSSSNMFGKSREISPLNMREGYVIFPETEGSPEKLTVRIKSGAKAEFRLR